MPRIKIQDLPRDMKVSEGEMRKVRGGWDPIPMPRVASLLSGGILPSIYTGPIGDMPIPIPSPAGRLFRKK